MNQCHECSDKVKQALLANIFDALLDQFKLLIDSGIMDIEMDVDEFYNGGHGIRIRFMDDRFYVNVYRTSTSN